MTRIFAVIDVDTDFGGDMTEAATWLDANLSRSSVKSDTTVYKNLAELHADLLDRQGAFEFGGVG
jgi:hypothetical protein